MPNSLGDQLFLMVDESLHRPDDERKVEREPQKNNQTAFVHRESNCLKVQEEKMVLYRSAHCLLTEGMPSFSKMGQHHVDLQLVPLEIAALQILTSLIS